MARYTYDITIVGGGSGGLTAARIARSFGARVCLVDKQRLGGDCLHYGCVPSKSLLHIAKMAYAARHAAHLGLAEAASAPDMAKVSAYIQGVIERVGAEEQADVRGVDVRFGTFAFAAPHTFTLDGVPYSSKAFIIATGSHATVPPVEGLADVDYWTNEDAFDLHHLPPTLAVVGGGPIGCELAQAFARLGTRVTLVQGPDRLLPREEPEVSEAIAAVLRRDGITVQVGARMQQVRTDGGDTVVVALQAGEQIEMRASHLLIALGRSPNTTGLNLEAAGVAYTDKGITVDDHLRTSARNIYAIGDVIGGYLFTHVAAYQAGVAVRNILVPLRSASVNYDALPWATFTEPEVARIGQTEAAARSHAPVQVVRMPWRAIDRAQTDDTPEGFIKLVLHAKHHTILGAHMVGASSGELLAELGLAMKHQLPVNAIVSTIHAYPTLNTGLQQIAFEAYLESSAVARARTLLRPWLWLRSWR